MILQDTYQALQMGLVSPQAVNNARMRAMQEMDIDGVEEFMIPPEPKPQKADVRVNAKDLTDGEMAQVVQSMGLKPDIQGRELNENNRTEELEFDQLAEVAKLSK